MAPHPFDGIRPRGACCERCGYQFGGVPIIGGIIVCAECGHANRFELRAPPRRDRPPRLIRAMFLLALAALLTVIVLGVLVH